MVQLIMDRGIDNGPRRHPTFSFFVTKEQGDMLLEALNALEKEYQTRTVTDELRNRYNDLRRRIVNMRDAIKRREAKGTKA